MPPKRLGRPQVYCRSCAHGGGLPQRSTAQARAWHLARNTLRRLTLATARDESAYRMLADCCEACQPFCFVWSIVSFCLPLMCLLSSLPCGGLSCGELQLRRCCFREATLSVPCRASVFLGPAPRRSCARRRHCRRTRGCRGRPAPESDPAIRSLAIRVWCRRGRFCIIMHIISVPVLS